MSKQDLLEMLEEGLENGRIKPYLAAYIATEVLYTDPRAAGYDDLVSDDDIAE